jgi:hypothetical protein
LEVRASPGPHLLRIEAPGHLPYGDLVEVLSGERPPIRVALAEDVALRAEEALLRAGSEHDLAAAARVLREARGALGPLYVLEVGAGPEDRATLSRCRAEGCEGPQALPSGGSAEPGEVLSLRLERSSDRLFPSLSAARRWLAEAPLALGSGSGAEDPLPPPPIWERWALWTGIGAAVLVLGGAALGVALASEEPQAPPLRIEVDPGDLANP